MVSKETPGEKLFTSKNATPALADAKSEARKKEFLNEFNENDIKKRRHEHTEQLRKKNREEHFSKKRAIGPILVPESPATAGVEFKIEDLPQLVAWINSADAEKVLLGTVGIRKLLAKNGDSYTQPIVDANVVHKFLEFLDPKYPTQLRYEACWCLTNIAAGTEEHIQSLTEKGAVPLLIKLLADEYRPLRDQAIWALGNIAGENVSYRDLVLNCGVLSALADLFKSTTEISIIKNACWTLANLTRGCPRPPFETMKAIVPTLCSAICLYEDKDLLVDCCWSLAFIVDGSDKEKLEAVVKCAVTPRLIKLVLHPSQGIAIPSLRVLGSLLAGDEEIVQQTIELGLLPHLYAVLSHAKERIRKEAAWVASNIAAGTPKQVHALVEAGVMQRLVDLSRSDIYDVKKECMWALSNAVDRMTDLRMIEMVLNMGVIEGFCGMLYVNDARTLLVIMEGLEALLKHGKENFLSPEGVNPVALRIDECGGLTALEKVEEHQNTEVYEKALNIIEEFFGFEDEEMNDIDN